MKTLRYLLISSLVIFTLGCIKDPMEDTNNGDWNHERNILRATFQNQIGDAKIVRDGDIASIEFTYNTYLPGSLSAVTVDMLETSIGAVPSVKKGETLNFDNPTKTATITVASTKGKTLDWVISLIPFSEQLIGKWNIRGLGVYGGTGAAYGGDAFMEMNSKSWCFTDLWEYDNSLEFTLEGFTATGHPTGKCINSAGADGKYGEFIFVDSGNKIGGNQSVAKFYRVIPKGESTWIRDYAANTVTFTVNGVTTSSSFENPGVSAGTNNKASLTYNAFKFKTAGKDNWDNIYNDYDKFYFNPRYFFIQVEKE